MGFCSPLSLGLAYRRLFVHVQCYQYANICTDAALQSLRLSSKIAKLFAVGMWAWV